MSVLGQYAANMPGGYFGRFDQVTSVGETYVAAVFLAAAVGIWAWLGQRTWASAFTVAFLSLNLGIFVPPLAADPVVAGAVVLWHLVLLSRALFPFVHVSPLGALRGEEEHAGRLREWLELNRHPLQHLLMVSVVLTVTVVGFRIGDRVPAQVVCLLLDALLVGLTFPFLRLAYRSGSRVPLLLAVPLVLAALTAQRPSLGLAWLGIYQVGALATLLSYSTVTEELLEFFYRRPALLVAASFAVIISLGTLFLSFPAASAGPRAISPLDALFTATSATCVTGLIVLNTPVAFSTFGHAVILALIQTGGLNIMVLSAFAALLLGRRLGLKGERALGEVLDLPTARTAHQITAFIVVSTVIIEAMGAVPLALAFFRHGNHLGEAVWKGVFHSVSAFCNAGFALQSDSFKSFQQHPMPLLVVAALITLGGLGFNVLVTGWMAIRRQGRRGLSVQVKLVLAVSAFLIVVGTGWFAVTEWHSSLAGLGFGDKLVNSLFQSVTLRTAGFNSVDMRLLRPASVVFMLVWMFIGASPGGTGGGIKTTTAAVLLGAIPAISRGESRIVMFGRTVPLEIVYRSAAIAAIASLVAFGATALLLMAHPFTLQVAVYEVLSALGTVGLSLGATSQLGPFGKLIIVSVMFIGRIGPLSLALLLTRGATGRIVYPDARLMVG